MKHKSLNQLRALLKKGDQKSMKEYNDYVNAYVKENKIKL